MSQLKIFIWENVRCDWTCGGAMAIALTLDDARQSLLVRDELNEGDKSIILNTEPNHVIIPVRDGWTFVWEGGS